MSFNSPSARQDTDEQSSIARDDGAVADLDVVDGVFRAGSSVGGDAGSVGAGRGAGEAARQKPKAKGKSGSVHD
jgi:hypothetical protein